MNEFTIERIAASYKQALNKMKEPYSKVMQFKPEAQSAPEPSFTPPPTAMLPVGYVRPGNLR